MSFSAPGFLSLYLPLALVLSALLRGRRGYKAWHSLLGLLLLLLAGWQQPLFFLAFVLSNLLVSALPGRLRKAAALALNLGAVLLVKLLPFFSTGLALPLGLSYAAFQALAFHLEGNQEARPLDLVFYLLFFPKLPMGPLAGFQELTAQQPRREQLWQDLEAGLTRLALGLFKKLLIADRLAGITGAVYQAAPGDRVLALALLGLLIFPLQLYFDFSGYTDIALGAARALGFSLPENFNRPFAAAALRDFWRRWHMSLTGWFGRWVYIPLGGSRQGPGRSLANTLAVFLLIALWHGIGWGFVLWGLWNALVIALERRGFIRPQGWPRALQALYVYIVAALGFLPFAAQADLAPAFSAFFRPGNLPLARALLGPGALVSLGLALLLLLLEGRGWGGRLPVPLRQGLALLVLALALLAAFGASHLPFLYGAY